MANRKISELTAATSATGSELLAIVQSGVTKKIDAATLIAGAGSIAGAVLITTAQTITGQKTLQATNASTVASIVKGVAAQSADLQQWQNSAGTVLAKFDPTGSLTATNLSATNVVSTPYIADSAATGPYLEQLGSNISIRRRASGQYLVLELQALVTAQASGDVPLFVKGAAAQSADLTQWQNSAGAVLASIGPQGGILQTQAFVANAFGGSPAGSTVLTVNTGTAALIGITVKGASSQTGNLQEWQDSAGAVLLKVNSVGALSSSWWMLDGWNARGSIGTPTPIAGITWLVQPLNASTVGTVVRGVASQTADLTQWQNSAGAVLAYMATDGTFHTGPYLAGSSNNKAYWVTPETSGIGWQLQNRGSANTAPLTVIGQAAQTGDLTQWQNSAGTVLASISAGGLLTLRQSTATSAQFDLKDSTGVSVAQIRGMAGANMGIGANSLQSVTTGTWNVGIGSDTLANTTAGYLNVGIGLNALKLNTLGFHNTAIGAGALAFLTGDPGALPGTIATNNTAIGANSSGALTSGHRNVSIGVDALWVETTGAVNVAIGVHAADHQVGVDGTVAVGYFALSTNVTGIDNTAVGRQALGAATANNGTAIGAYAAGAVSTGVGNTAIGAHALFSPNGVFANRTQTGAGQVAIGPYTGQAGATVGAFDYGVAVGYQAIFGYGSLALGAYANAAHTYSVALGYGTTTTADSQVMVGAKDLEITDAAKGVVLKSPNGTRYRLTVADDGALVTAAA